MKRYDFGTLVVEELKEEKDIQAALDLFRQACVERGWPAKNNLEHYLSSSIFWGGFRDGTLVCAVQLVTNSPIGLPIVDKDRAWPELALVENCAEVAMVAVERKARGAAFLFIPLYIELYKYSKAQGIKAWYAIIDRDISRLYEHFEIKFLETGAHKVYWGDECFPAILTVEKLEHDLQQDNPELWSVVSGA